MRKTTLFSIFSKFEIFINITKINNIKKTLQNMKRKIRLSESDLHKIVKETVKKVLKEEADNEGKIEMYNINAASINDDDFIQYMDNPKNRNIFCSSYLSYNDALKAVRYLIKNEFINYDDTILVMIGKGKGYSLDWGLAKGKDFVYIISNKDKKTTFATMKDPSRYISWKLFEPDEYTSEY